MNATVPLKIFKVPLLLTVLLLTGVSSGQAQQKPDGKWLSLFNGKNLDQWVVKFTGHELGNNYRNTFRVEDGLLKISYDDWDEWDGSFGHLFYDRSFSDYLLRVEYRFVGDQVKKGPEWAFRNNGLMLHSQDPRTMVKNQEFPVSIETQLLGGSGRGKRSTLNICTPGTNVVMEEALKTRHCISSTSKTYHGDQWVTAEIEVRGNRMVRHKIDGKVVFKYTKPQLDPKDPDARRLMKAAGSKNLMIKEGYIAIQAESHPTEFRKIELLPLQKDQ